MKVTASKPSRCRGSYVRRDPPIGLFREVPTGRPSLDRRADGPDSIGESSTAELARRFRVVRDLCGDQIQKSPVTYRASALNARQLCRSL